MIPGRRRDVDELAVDLALAAPSPPIAAVRGLAAVPRSPARVELRLVVDDTLGSPSSACTHESCPCDALEHAAPHAVRGSRVSPWPVIVPAAPPVQETSRCRCPIDRTLIASEMHSRGRMESHHSPSRVVLLVTDRLAVGVVGCRLRRPTATPELVPSRCTTRTRTSCRACRPTRSAASPARPRTPSVELAERHPCLQPPVSPKTRTALVSTSPSRRQRTQPARRSAHPIL